MTDKDSDRWRKSPAYLEQLASLPSALRSQYSELVEEYRFYAFTHHSFPFVSYRILADLIRSGWRHNDAPMSPRETQDD